MGSDNKKGRFCCVKFVGVSAIAVTLIWYFVYFAHEDNEDYVANCGGCYCVPDNTSSFSCPSIEEFVVPLTSYPDESHLNVWKSQTILNPYLLSCNPYEDKGLCDTEPPLEWETLGKTAVCAVHYEQEPQERRRRRLQQQESEIEVDEPKVIENIATTGVTTGNSDKTCGNGAYYRIKTYPSRADAKIAGGWVTHVGHCGVCSTVQDLAVYANIDFVGVTSPGHFCRRQAATSFENGLSCYQGLGMTQDCARIWSDTSWNTASNCFGSCVLDPTLPVFGGDGFSSSNNIDATNASDTSSNKWYDLPITLKERLFSYIDMNETMPVSKPGNGPAPGCALNDCLVCNEETSAPTFDKFAGRNRRTSGLLSTVAFACGSIPNIVQDPCPITKPLLE